jgi:hypothetical protein
MMLSSIYASSRARPVRALVKSIARRAASSVASSTLGPTPTKWTAPPWAIIGRSSTRQFDQIDRDNIAGFSAAHDNRSSYRRQGMPVASRGEWRRYRGDIFDIIKGAAYLDRELLAGIDSHCRRCVCIDREEVFSPVRPHGAAPYALQTPGGIATQGLGILQSRILTLPEGERRPSCRVLAPRRKMGRAVWAGLCYRYFDSGGSRSTKIGRR